MSQIRSRRPITSSASQAISAAEPDRPGGFGAGQGALRELERVVRLSSVDRAAGRYRVSPAAEPRVRRSFGQCARRGDLLLRHRHLVALGK